MSKAIPRVWVLSLNDLEAVEILHLLDAGHARVFISYQRWGATWAGLESPILNALKSERECGEVEIVGIELGGHNPFEARNVDHHRYEGDDRWRPESSLEQVAAILGTTLTQYQKMAAVNDRAHIAGLQREFGGLSAVEIADLRRADRRAQGLTENDEDRARVDIRRAVRKGAFAFLEIEGRPNAAHFDFLLAPGKIDDILIATPDLWQYSGRQASLLSHEEWAEKYWSGGAVESGYFCIQSPGDKSQRRLRGLLG